MPNIEKIKISSDLKYFLAYSDRKDYNIYIIYKFSNQLDSMGYHTYFAVSIINHP